MCEEWEGEGEGECVRGMSVCDCVCVGVCGCDSLDCCRRVCVRRGGGEGVRVSGGGVWVVVDVIVWAWKGVCG